MYPCSLWNLLKLEIKPLFWLVCTSCFLSVYTCSWFVYMSLYLFMYIMNVYMLVYWLCTYRHFCLLYYEINSWNSYLICKALNWLWTHARIRSWNKPELTNEGKKSSSTVIHKSGDTCYYIGRRPMCRKMKQYHLKLFFPNMWW